MSWNSYFRGAQRWMLFVLYVVGRSGPNARVDVLFQSSPGGYLRSYFSFVHTIVRVTDAHGKLNEATQNYTAVN